MKTEEITIPEISDEVLAERMARIKFVTQAMSGLDGKAYPTDEQDKKLFDLFYSESNADPRTQAFNFDEKSVITTKATGLTELLKKDIFVKIGGYHGFCKITMAEVLSQIPDEILSNVVAFALDPEKSAEMINEDYQSKSIIFYGKAEQVIVDENLPSSAGLLKPVDMQKAFRLKDAIKPIINYANEGYSFIEPEDIEQPFMNIGIWLRVNGSNLHRTNKETKVTVPCKLGEKVSVYQEFTDGADFFKPSYAYTISQIPDELINNKTIGILYHATDYFKTKEGVVHKTEYTLVEKE